MLCGGKTQISETKKGVGTMIVSFGHLVIGIYLEFGACYLEFLTIR